MTRLLIILLQNKKASTMELSDLKDVRLKKGDIILHRHQPTMKWEITSDELTECSEYGTPVLYVDAKYRRPFSKGFSLQSFKVANLEPITESFSFWWQNSAYYKKVENDISLEFLSLEVDTKLVCSKTEEVFTITKNFLCYEEQRNDKTDPTSRNWFAMTDKGLIKVYCQNLDYPPKSWRFNDMFIEYSELKYTLFEH